MRLAAIGDVHAEAVPIRRNRRSRNTAPVARGCLELLLLAGDLTDHGQPEQAVQLAQQLEHVKIPIVSVLGNHDFECGRPFAVADALERVGVRMLDGTSVIIGDLGIAGVKGFGGGFDPRHLGYFGERVMKDFVAEIEQEAEKLATALESLSTRFKVVLLHYAPVSHDARGRTARDLPVPRIVDAFLSGNVTDSGCPLCFMATPMAGTFAGVRRLEARYRSTTSPQRLLRRMTPGRGPTRCSTLRRMG